MINNTVIPTGNNSDALWDTALRTPSVAELNESCIPLTSPHCRPSYVGGRCRHESRPTEIAGPGGASVRWRFKCNSDLQTLMFSSSWGILRFRSRRRKESLTLRRHFGILLEPTLAVKSTSPLVSLYRSAAHQQLSDHVRHLRICKNCKF